LSIRTSIPPSARKGVDDTFGGRSEFGHERRRAADCRGPCQLCRPRTGNGRYQWLTSGRLCPPRVAHQLPVVSAQIVRPRVAGLFTGTALRAANIKDLCMMCVISICVLLVASYLVRCVFSGHCGSVGSGSCSCRCLRVAGDPVGGLEQALQQDRQIVALGVHARTPGNRLERPPRINPRNVRCGDFLSLPL